jgi:hypothetical protein
MLSALVIMPPHVGGTSSALGALVRTLAALVPATVEGLVRDVTVVTDRADDGIRRVADHAGCGIVETARFEEGFTQALSGVRSSQLFVLRAGAAFDRSFVDEMAMLLGPEGEADRPRALLLREMPDGLLSRLLPNRAPVAGLIAPLADLSAPARDFAALARRLVRPRTLTSRARMAL